MIKMGLFKRNTMETNVNTIKDYERIQKELAYMLKKAIGHRSIEDFCKQLKMVDPKPIVSILKREYKEFPDRKLLRKIANNSQGRVTHYMLYDLCGYKESDPEEDHSWKNWIPKRGDIFYADLGIQEDSLQGGQRPVLVLGNDLGLKYSSILFGIPLSSKNKGNSKMHVLVEKEYGLERNSIILCEQTRVISKRSFFFNGNPWKVCTLDENKLQQVRNILEFQLGFESLNFDENKAYSMIEKIKLLQNNIKIKKSNNLIDILNEKFDELIQYCGKYHKNYEYFVKEYDRINNYSYQTI